MSRVPSSGGTGCLPFGGAPGLPGSNPRAAALPPGRLVTGGDGLLHSQRGDLRVPISPASRSPGMARYSAKSPPLTQGGPRQVPLRVEKVSDKSLQTRLIYGNLCAIAPEDFPPNRDGTDLYVLIRKSQSPEEYVVTAKPIPGFPPGCISLSDPQRSWCDIAFRDQFTGEIYDPFASGGIVYLGTMDAEIGFASPNKTTEAPYDENELSKVFVETFQNQVLSPGQRILMDVRNIPLLVIVKTVGLVDLAMASEEGKKQVFRDASARGILTNQTRLSFHRSAKGDLNIKPSMTKANTNAILAPDFKFEDMGIGGLGNQLTVIFRRAFASRLFPPGLIAKMGIKHVKGMLLYGPPGTGKTLIARRIGEMLNARPPKVINGPEVLNKYVGQSEENIRNLFADAEKEFKEKGDESSLHIIIFDELDAVCKKRGSGAGGGTGVGDSVVNQLLSKLDGVNQLNNILLIGMTNRKDMIDDALLRPGRLEMHVEISLPDEAGRLEIFKIHTANLLNNGFLNADVDLEELAGLTKNYSGAEINGVVRAATSFAFSRHTEVGQVASVKQDVAQLKVKREDFMVSLNDVQPAHGVSEADLDAAVRLGIIPYSPHIQGNIEVMMGVARTVRCNPKKFSSSVLFHGPRASGKTALVAHIARQSGFPFVKLITPAHLSGYRDEFAKRDYVHQVFTDAYKSPASIVILDDIERLIGWNPIGPRFSNTMLETLTTLVVSPPPHGQRLLVFATTSNLSAFQMLEADKDFEKKVAVPAVSNLRDLGAALQRSGSFDEGDMTQIANTVQQRTGSDRVGVGIKTILDHVIEAEDQAAEAADRGGQADVIDVFSELLLESMQKNVAR